jgi:hypothetical protein
MNTSLFSQIVELLQAISNILLIIIAIWAGIVAVRQLRISATTDLYNKLSSSEARDNRRWIYHNCEEITDVERLNEWEKNPTDLDRLETLCTSLDWVGLSVRKGFLKKTDVIDLYGDSLIRLWVGLKPWILYYRRLTGSPEWLWKDFEWLAGEAIKQDRFSSWLKEGVPFFTPTTMVRFEFKDSSVKGIDRTFNENDHQSSMTSHDED